MVYPGITTVLNNATNFNNLRRACSMLSYDLRIAVVDAPNRISNLATLLSKAKVFASSVFEFFASGFSEPSDDRRVGGRR